MMTEINMDITTTMSLPSQYLMVQYLIQSWRLGIPEEDRMIMVMALRTQRTIYIPYLRRCAMNWCMQNLAFSTGVSVTHTKIFSSIDMIIDYIFDIYKRFPLIAFPQFSLVLTEWCPKQPISKDSKWCHNLMLYINVLKFC